VKETSREKGGQKEGARGTRADTKGKVGPKVENWARLKRKQKESPSLNRQMGENRTSQKEKSRKKKEY